MKDKWIVWSQHFMGYKPRKFATYFSENEAVCAAEILNSSPSSKWFIYSFEFKSSEASHEQAR